MYSIVNFSQFERKKSYAFYDFLSDYASIIIVIFANYNFVFVEMISLI
jgi:hypothetical protein